MEKLYLCIFAIIFFAMVTIPLIAVKQDVKNTSSTVASVLNNKNQSNKPTVSETQKVKVFINESKEIKSVAIDEYLIGVCSAEMDESYPDEALKAQAVAAHTLLLFRKAENSKKDYDITNVPANDQGYLTREKREEKYGEQLDSLEKRLKSVVNEVKNKVIYYHDKPILAVYHDTSGGKTENAKDIWGGDYPYLQSVESISDLLNPAYLSTVTYTKQEFLSRLKGIGGSLPKKSKDYIGKSETTASGTVKKIKIGNKSFSGQNLREAFDLRSANFDLKFEKEKFIFTVRGFGHGVGMSQYGASFMAKEGSTYKEILNWYYKNCEIKG